MAANEIRVTVAVAAVLSVFLDNVEQPRYGYELMQVTGFASGKLYPILARLEGAGWLEKEWEINDPSVEGRPARRWYRLSGSGAAAAYNELAKLSRQLTPKPIRNSPATLRPEGGVA